jgi:hypothetical protein
MFKRLSSITGKPTIAILTLVTLCNIAMLLFYNAVTYRVLMHSDAASLNLMADEVYRTGQLFPSEWNYPNGDLWAFYGHLFILPFLPFVKNGFAMHVVAGTLTGALVLLGVWLLTKVLEIHLVLRLLFMAVLTSGVSHFFADQVFGQLTYGTVLLLFVFQFYFFFRYWKSVACERPDGWALTGFCAVLFIVFLSNPSRAMATNLAPLAAGFFLWGIHLTSTHRWPDNKVLRRALGKPALIAGAAIFAGGIGHAIVLAQTHYHDGAANVMYIAPTDISRNILGTLRGWLNIVGGLPSADERVIGIRGIHRAYLMLVAICLLIFPVYLWRSLRSQRDDIVRFLLVSVLATFCIALFFQLFTTVPDMSAPSEEIHSARYMVVTVFMVALAAVVLLNQSIRMEQPWNIPLVATICLFPFLISGFSILVTPGFVIQRSPSLKLSRTPAPMDVVINRLEAENLHYGYSSYWNANLNTVLSKGAQKIRAVHLLSLPIPMPHLSSNDWFRPSAHQGPVFLLLNAKEYDTVDWAEMNAWLGKPSQSLTEGEWKIIVYPFNISTRLPGWDERLSEPLTYVLRPTSLHQIGRLEPSIEGNLMAAEQSEQGYLAYGPYAKLAKGRYEAQFSIQAHGAKGILAEIDVAVNGGKNVVKAAVQAADGWQTFALPFDVESAVDAYEFRVLTTGAGWVKSKAITLKRLDTAKHGN